MGKALQFLGAARCASIVAELVSVDGRKGNENDLWFCCPFHSEKTASAHYDVANDVYHCFGCQAGGDLIEFYSRLGGMDETEGFIAFMKAYCPERMGEGAKKVETAAKPLPAACQQWQPDSAYIPPQKWQDKALAIVRECAEALQGMPEQLARLAAWGIDARTAEKCLIGWNVKDRFYPVTAMDLPYAPARSNAQREKKIWWPQGFVFASFRDGRPAKVKVRAENPLPGMPRYFQIYAGVVPAGKRSPYLIAGRHDFKIWIIVETDRDAYLVWSACRGLPVGVMAVGSAGARPDAYAAQILRDADLILCALDNDQAGRKFANGFWADEFPQSLRWPVPVRYGKDVGDAVWPVGFSDPFMLDDFYTACFNPFYLDVRSWITAGIPSHIRRKFTPRKVSQQIEQEKQVSAKDVLDASARPVSSPGSDVLLLAEVMRRNCIGLQLDEGIRIVEPEPGWFNQTDQNWRAFEHVSSLVFGKSAQISSLLDSLDDGLITATTILKPWLDAGWRPAGGSF